MSSTSDGKSAEVIAADYLASCGYRIIEKNWRTRFCEIDIVAQKYKIVFFAEVKYRNSSIQGTGLDYITQKKQKQMAFAATSWVQSHDWTGDYRLLAVEVSGSKMEVTEIVEL